MTTALALAFLALSGPPKKKPVVKPKPKPALVRVAVNLKEGEPFTGDRSFKVSVESGEPVTQVEFYVGDDLRDNDTSVPYEFRLDALDETDGPLRLRFKAYTGTGRTGEKIVTVKIDNDVAGGAAKHVALGREALSAGKTAEAITQGRIALKADTNDYDAKVLLATAYSLTNVFDKAQKYAEDALIVKKDEPEALDLLAGISVRRALTTVSRGGSGSSASTITESLKIGVEARRKAAEIRADRALASDASLVAKADALLAATRYAAAINLLLPEWRTKPETPGVADRLAYAQLRAGRYADANETLRQTLRFLPAGPDGKPRFGAYLSAVEAILRSQAGDQIAAQAAVTRGAAIDANELGVKTARAFLALRRNDAAALGTSAKELAADAGSRPVASYYVAAVANRQKRYEDGRKAFQRAALADPLFYDAYLESGLQSLALAATYVDPAEVEPLGDNPTDEDKKAFEDEKKVRDTKVADLKKRRTEYYISARTMFEAVIVARPEAADGLVGLASVSGLEEKWEEALKWGRAAAAAAPSSPAAQYALAGTLAGRARKAKPAEADALVAESRVVVSRAATLDPAALRGAPAPNPNQLWTYLAGPGRTPVISAPR